MKRLLVLLLPVVAFLHSASAQDGRALDRAQQGGQFALGPDRDGDRGGRWWRLRSEADRLTSMTDSVRFQMRRYGASSFQRRRLSQVQSDVSRINYKVRNRVGDRDQIYRDIQSARIRLHQIELDLRFRPRDYYRW